MGGIRIEGSSGNVADATSAGNLKVQLPNTAAQVGSVRMMSENDDGSITGSPQLKSPETSIDYRLRVGTDSVLDFYTFTSSTFFASKFTTDISQAYIGYGQNYGYSLRINTNLSTAASANGLIKTRRTFVAYSQNVPLYCETSWSISAAVVGSTVYEVGLIGYINGGGAVPSDGAGFRVTNGGIFGFVIRNGTETLTSGALLQMTPGTVYNTTIVLGTGEVQFFINDIAYSMPLKTAYTDVVKWTGLSWTARIYQASAVASSQYMTVWQYSVMQGDIPIAMPQSHNAVLMNGHVENSPWFPNGVVSYTLDTAPASYTLGTSINSFPYGHIQYPATITAAETDRAVFQWSINSVGEHKRFVMTGIRICEAMVTGAVTGGPLLMQWSLAHSYRLINDSDPSSNPITSQSSCAPRFFMIGTQSISANAAAGYVSLPLDVELGNSPIVFVGDLYNRLQVRFLGTSTSAGTIRQAFQIRGYWI